MPLVESPGDEFRPTLELLARTESKSVRDDAVAELPLLLADKTVSVNGKRVLRECFRETDIASGHPVTTNAKAHQEQRLDEAAVWRFNIERELGTYVRRHYPHLAQRWIGLPPEATYYDLHPNLISTDRERASALHAGGRTGRLSRAEQEEFASLDERLSELTQFDRIGRRTSSPLHVYDRTLGAIAALVTTNVIEGLALNTARVFAICTRSMPEDLTGEQRQALDGFVDSTDVAVRNAFVDFSKHYGIIERLNLYLLHDGHAPIELAGPDLSLP